MSNETKRDVFGQLLNAYQNLIAKDNEMHYEAYRENITTPWNIVYDAALPDDLPVIPKAVGEYIKDNKDLNLLVALTIANNGYRHSELWIAMYQDTFARAWVLGVWRVEETGEVVKL